MSEKKTTQEILDMLTSATSESAGLADMFLVLAQLSGPNQNVEKFVDDDKLDYSEAVEIGLVNLFVILYRETHRIAENVANAYSELEFATREERTGK